MAPRVVDGTGEKTQAAGHAGQTERGMVGKSSILLGMVTSWAISKSAIISCLLKVENGD